MKFGRKKSSLSVSSSHTSIITRVFSISWLAKFKKKGANSENDSIQQRGKLDFPTPVSSLASGLKQGRLYSMDDDDDAYWRISFGEEKVEGRMSTGGMKISPVWYDSEDEVRLRNRDEYRNFDNMVLNIKKMKDKQVRDNCGFASKSANNRSLRKQNRRKQAEIELEFDSLDQLKEDFWNLEFSNSIHRHKSLNFDRSSATTFDSTNQERISNSISDQNNKLKEMKIKDIIRESRSSVKPERISNSISVSDQNNKLKEMKIKDMNRGSRSSVNTFDSTKPERISNSISVSDQNNKLKEMKIKDMNRGSRSSVNTFDSTKPERISNSISVSDQNNKLKEMKIKDMNRGSRSSVNTFDSTKPERISNSISVSDQNNKLKEMKIKDMNRGSRSSVNTFDSTKPERISNSISVSDQNNKLKEMKIKDMNRGSRSSVNTFDSTKPERISNSISVSDQNNKLKEMKIKDMNRESRSSVNTFDTTKPERISNSNSVSDQNNKSKLMKIKDMNRESRTRKSKQSSSSRARAYSPRTECKIRAIEEMKKARMKLKKMNEMKEQAMDDDRTVFDSFAVVKSSYNPENDFRDSMVEMIQEKGIRRPEELEELLACYLTLNCDEYHDLIIKCFRRVWFELNKGVFGSSFFYD